MCRSGATVRCGTTASLGYYGPSTCTRWISVWWALPFYRTTPMFYRATPVCDVHMAVTGSHSQWSVVAGLGYGHYYGVSQKWPPGIKSEKNNDLCIIIFAAMSPEKNKMRTWQPGLQGQLRLSAISVGSIPATSPSTPHHNFVQWRTWSLFGLLANCVR